GFLVLARNYAFLGNPGGVPVVQPDGDRSKAGKHPAEPSRFPKVRTGFRLTANAAAECYWCSEVFPGLPDSKARSHDPSSDRWGDPSRRLARRDPSVPPELPARKELLSFDPLSS